MENLQGTYGRNGILADTHGSHRQERHADQARSKRGIIPKAAGQEEVQQVNYITIESIDESIAKVKKFGGKILVPKQQVPTLGLIVVAAILKETSSGC
jgi:predicted enzyme related to lactoylglutathione lyase